MLFYRPRLAPNNPFILKTRPSKYRLCRPLIHILLLIQLPILISDQRPVVLLVRVVQDTANSHGGNMDAYRNLRQHHGLLLLLGET